MQFDKLEKSDMRCVVDCYREYIEDLNWVDYYFSEDFINKGGFGFKAVEDGRICGFIVASKGVNLSGRKYPKVENKIYKKYDVNQIYTIDLCFVKPEYRGLSLSDRLNSIMKKEMRSRGIDKVFLEMTWNENKQFAGEHLGLKHFSLIEYYGEFDDVYKGETPQEKECIICKKNPCECHTKFYLCKV